MIDFSDVKDAERVLRLFLEISEVPRASGNTAPIADFLVRFAKEHGLEYYRDGFDNVIIKKSASAGYSDREPLIIQGHSDIVAEKDPDCKADTEHDGIRVYRDGDFLRAEGTTLGADDGIASAYALALLESDSIPHPPLEVLITSNEEIGLIGAAHLDTTHLTGRTLINIDSEDEGIFTVGCAGGIRADLTLCGTRKKSDGRTYAIEVRGLNGGHSGTEIGKGGANAVKVLSEILSALPSPLLFSVSGGSKDNAIPRSTRALVCLSSECEMRLISEAADSVKKKYIHGDPELDIICTPTKTDTAPFDRKTSAAVISLLSALPYGVIKMSEDIEDMPELSVNIGTVKTDGEKISVGCSLRSAEKESKLELLKSIEDIAAEHGAHIETSGDYPGWKYRQNSRIRDIMCAEFFKMYGKSAAVEIIHAGLECGILFDKIPNLDCISIGPDIFDAHTTGERLSISSAARVWKFLKNVLKSM